MCLESMGMRLVGKDSLVVVSYDFEYTTEEGKRVWMKEGEVLLLINKTNNDWWQVSYLKYFDITANQKRYPLRDIRVL